MQLELPLHSPSKLLHSLYMHHRTVKVYSVPSPKSSTSYFVYIVVRRFQLKIRRKHCNPGEAADKETRSTADFITTLRPESLAILSPHFIVRLEDNQVVNIHSLEAQSIKQTSFSLLDLVCAIIQTHPGSSVGTILGHSVAAKPQSYINITPPLCPINPPPIEGTAVSASRSSVRVLNFLHQQWVQSTTSSPTTP